MFDFLLFLQAVWTLVCCEKEILRLGKHGTCSFPKCWSTWKIWQLVMKRPLEYLWRAAMVVWVVWVRVLSQHEKIPRSRNFSASQNGWSLLQEGRSKARPGQPLRQAPSGHRAGRSWRRPLLALHTRKRGLRASADLELRHLRVAVTAQVPSNCFQIYICVQRGFGAILNKTEKKLFFTEALKTNTFPHDNF